MAGFLVICLDDEDLERVDVIIKNVAQVSSADDAVKWALKKCSMQSPVRLGEIETESIEPTLFSPERVKPGELPTDLILPLGTHHVAYIPLKHLADSEHSVMMASATLKLLVPDKGKRIALFGDDPTF